MPSLWRGQQPVEKHHFLYSLFISYMMHYHLHLLLDDYDLCILGLTHLQKSYLQANLEDQLATPSLANSFTQLVLAASHELPQTRLHYAE